MTESEEASDLLQAIEHLHERLNELARDMSAMMRERICLRATLADILFKSSDPMAGQLCRDALERDEECSVCRRKHSGGSL